MDGGRLPEAYAADTRSLSVEGMPRGLMIRDGNVEVVYLENGLGMPSLAFCLGYSRYQVPWYQEPNISHSWSPPAVPPASVLHHRYRQPAEPPPPRRA